MLATIAALDYLELLYRRFDDWYLAIAAYNAGEGRMSSAIRRSGEKDFFKLKLPKETQGYIPRLLAFAAVFYDPRKYDLSLPFIAARADMQSIKTHSQFDLTQAATTLGVTVEKLYDWNPALNQWATHPQGPHRLLVSHRHPNAQSLIDTVPTDQRLRWQRRTISSGDTLSEIAERNNIGIDMLMRANNLTTHLIRTGRQLLVPTAAHHTTGTDNQLLPPSRRRGRSQKSYRVVRGDSLSELAKRYGVSMRELMRSNQIGLKTTLRVGQRLVIPIPADNTLKAIKYRVRQGDSLSLIAARFNVTAKQIRGWNALNLTKYLQPGQQLRLYVDLTAAN